jgi:hypothetical protein
VLASDFASGQAWALHANIISDSAALFTNFAQENPMNSIRVDRDFTVSLVPYSDYPRAAYWHRW